MASLNPFHYIKKGYDAIVNPDGPATAPGVGGPAKNPAVLQHDANTGMWFDPTTGTTYLDATGQQPVKDPNVAQQVAQNFQQRQQLLQQAQAQQGVVNQAEQGQQGLAASLNNTINNPNAPSVAATQLTGSNDNLGRTQLAIASGQGGPNAAAGRRQAAMNIGQQGADMAQSGALLRAGEVQSAQGQLGGVLSNLAGQGINQYGQNLSGAGNFANLANTGAGGNQTADINAKNQSNASWAGLVNGATGAGAKALGI